MDEKEQFRFSVTSRFITNSSSVVHFIKKEVLNNPRVAEFIDRYGLFEHVGDLTYRSSTAIGLTKDGVDEIVAELRAFGREHCPSLVVDVPNEEVIAIAYGDEYTNAVRELACIIHEIDNDRKKRDKFVVSSIDFN